MTDKSGMTPFLFTPKDLCRPYAASVMREILLQQNGDINQMMLIFDEDDCKDDAMAKLAHNKRMIKIFDSIINN